MKQCFVCKSEGITQDTTSQLYEENGHMVIIKGVHCSKCNNCGETYLSTEVMRELEKYLDSVQFAELEVVSYAKVAA